MGSEKGGSRGRGDSGRRLRQWGDVGRLLGGWSGFFGFDGFNRRQIRLLKLFWGDRNGFARSSGGFFDDLSQAFMGFGDNAAFLKGLHVGAVREQEGDKEIMDGDDFRGGQGFGLGCEKVELGLGKGLHQGFFGGLEKRGCAGEPRGKDKVRKGVEGTGLIHLS